MKRANWILVGVLLPHGLFGQVSVLTANYDNSRTNSNLSETLLNSTNVRAGSFGKIGSFPVDGQIYAQPLYAVGVPIPGVGVRDVVYTVTMHNSVYAIDAGAPASSVPLWQVNLGPAVPSSVLHFTDILPEVGILSTPVIDVKRQAIYVVSDTLEGGAPVFRMHALSLGDGHEMFYGPVVIGGSVAGNGAGSDGGVMPFDASMHLQRPGLALLNGVVYAAFGSHADGGAFHGWMIGYDGGDLRRQVAVFNSTPNAVGGSFWQGGRAPAIDRDGNIVAVSSNGDAAGASDFTNSILKLSGSDLSLLDWFTPANAGVMDAEDMDLGSTGAVLIDGGAQILAGGKSGDLVLVGGSSMGHVEPFNAGTMQSIRATDGGSAQGMYTLAVWQRRQDIVVYLHEPCGALKAYPIESGHLAATPQSQSNPGTCTLFSGIVVTANGGINSTGIVWQTTADWGARQIPGTLRAFDATDLTNELWNSDMNAGRDSLGRFAKFATPTVVNGRVYVPTFSNRLVIYGLLSSGVPDSTATAQVTVVANSASLLQGAVSPGEVVTISGANIGPDEVSDLEVDGTGHVPKVLADTHVFFDGIAAPLLYVSADEIGAVVPFGITGPNTQMKVAYGGRSAYATIPVVQAAPAFFALNGTGGGQGAVLNEDASVNSYDKPAHLGQAISIFGTGLGLETWSEDGMITASSMIVAALLPVTALINGQPAEVLYAGAAPGMVHGFIQVNVRIPDTVRVYDDGSATPVRVTIKAGQYTSPDIITLNVVQ